MARSLFRDKKRSFCVKRLQASMSLGRSKGCSRVQLCNQLAPSETLKLIHLKEWEPHPLPVKDSCVALLGYPRTGTSCPQYREPPFVASSHFEGPLFLPQASRLTFFFSNQDQALGQGRWGSMEEEEEFRTQGWPSTLTPYPQQP